MLARPLYRFRTIDLRQIPKAKRAQALKLQLRQWSPFMTPGYCIVWQRDSALLWCWDAERVQRGLAEAKLNPKRVQVLPESLVQPRHPSGFRLVRSLTGVEGQIWHDNSLAYSRWWPEVPKPQEWLAFQRDAGIPPERQQAVVPQPLSLPLQAAPWARPSGLGGYEESARRNEQLLYAVGVMLLALPTLWYGAQLYKLEESYAARQRELVALQAQARPLLEMRSQALESLARIRALAALDPYPDQLALMAKVAEILPKDGSYLKEWNYQSGKLKITITSPINTLSSSFLVNALQLAGPFTNVRANPSNDPKTISVNMDLMPGNQEASHV